MFLQCEPSSSLIQSPTHDKVLTGVLPYDSSDHYEIYYDITGGTRPSRPTGPGQKRWLQDPIWNVIEAGWHHEPAKRCELSVVYRGFLTGQQQVQNAKIGECSK